MRVVIAATAVIVTALLPVPAGAAPRATSATSSSTITCNKLTGNWNSVKFKGSACSAKAPKGYGNLTGHGYDLNTGGLYTWSGSRSQGGYIAIGDVTSTMVTPTAGCPKTWYEYVDTGTVTSTSSDPYDSSLLNGPTTLTLCYQGGRTLKMKLVGDNNTL